MAKLLTASINNNNKHLKELLGTGADSMKNLYYLSFSGGEFNKNSRLSTSLAVRSNSISIPSPKIGKDPKNFINVHVDMPKPSYEMDKSVTLSGIRLDESMKTYYDLLKMHSLTVNPSLSFSSTYLDPDKFFTLTVKVPRAEIMDIGSMVDPLNNEDSLVPIYIFRGCWVSKLTTPNFSYDDASAVTIDATIKFMEYEGPETLLDDKE